MKNKQFARELHELFKSQNDILKRGSMTKLEAFKKKAERLLLEMECLDAHDEAIVGGEVLKLRAREQ
jgi:hypothetical protein